MTKRNIFRRAGDKLREMDEAYAGKVDRFISGEPANDKGPIGVAREVIGFVAGATPGKTKIEFDDNDPEWLKKHGKHAEWAVPAAGLGIRYGIPAAGVTLAGKGIMDLTAQFNNMGDQQTGAEIGMV